VLGGRCADGAVALWFPQSESERKGGFCSANCAFCLSAAGSNQRVAAVIQAYAHSAAQSRGFAVVN
jgi:hypothetical protein